MFDYSERIQELSLLGFKIDKNTELSFYKIASNDNILNQARLIILDSGHLCAVWYIEKDIIEIECYHNDYKLIHFYHNNIIPDIFKFDFDQLQHYIDHITKKIFNMRTEFPIYGIPGKNGTFNTVATISIDKPKKKMKDGCNMGFKIHVSDYMTYDSYDTVSVVMDAISKEGWNPIKYQHVLYDEAFVNIAHANAEPMIIHHSIL